jgi:glycosyltransferase involved in cell wall biosynthesis
LKETLDSIFAQTYQNLEVVVVDDGSSFPLESILKKHYGNQVLFLRHKESKGAPVARNAGARQASGEYIAFLDDDDLWLPKKIEKQITVFDRLNEEYGVVYCGFDFLVNGRIVFRKNKYGKTGSMFPRSLSGCPFGSPTPLIRKKYFDQTGGFDEKLQACQDWDLWVRLSKICSFYPVQESLALYRIHGEQISTDVLKKIYSRNVFIDKYKKDLDSLPGVLSKHYCRLGALCRLAGEEKDSFSFYVKSLEKNPFNRNAWIHLLVSCVSVTVDKMLTKKFGTRILDGIRIIN